MNRTVTTLAAVLLVGAGGAIGGCGSSNPNPANQGDDGGNPYPDGGNDGGTGSDSSSDGNSGHDGGDGGNVTVLPGPSHGSAVALSPDDSTAVVVNRDVGTVTVLRITYPNGQPPAATMAAEIDVGAGSEPWQAVISPDGTRAFVVLRQTQQLVAIEDLGGSPHAGAKVAVGSEPTGVALTPTGAKAWVTNWVDGSVSIVDTSAMSVSKTIDLNAPLVATTLLGSVTARAALAHPRSVAITNNGDTNDADESAYVTEYYAQQTAAEANDGSNADTRKVGVVYKVAVADGSVSTTQIAPLTDMGFKDERNGTAGCFPNQLQSIAIEDHFAYVVSVCASPRGPTGPKVTATACTAVTDCAALNLVDAACVLPTATAANKVCVDVASVKTTTAPLVSVLDISGAQPSEVAGAAGSLNAAFEALYASKSVADDSTRRYPLFADDIAFVPGTGVGYVTANGADAVFRMLFDATGHMMQVGASTNNFIDLTPAGIAAGNAGKNPIGVAISNTGKGVAIVANDVSRNATIVDFKAQAISGGAMTPSVIATTKLPAAGTDDAARLAGKRFFDTGTGRWSLKGQAWGACQSCHGDGLTDNVTWYFARGPRQSTSLDATFDKNDPTDQRVLNWTGINDEAADFENNVRGVSGGIGAILTALDTPPTTADRMDIAANGNSALNGSAAKAADPNNPLQLAKPSVLTDWANITKFMQAIRSPRAPTTLDAAKVSAGQALFANDGACQGCHGGSKWTLSKVFYDPSPATNTALKTKAWPALNGFPSALLPATTAAGQVMRYGSTNPAALDQLMCVLRPVGTFGLAETGVGVAELRIDMTTAAQGNGDANGDGKGYNPPALLGLASGAPYLHAGQARTLESLFSNTFATHYGALAPNFLTDADPNVRAQKVDQLVSFLLSIDASTTSVPIPTLGAAGGDFCVSP
jgi:YVTN family beta-propeller protein